MYDFHVYSIFDALDYVTEFTFDPNLLDSPSLYIKGVPFKWILLEYLRIIDNDNQEEWKIFKIRCCMLLFYFAFWFELGKIYEKRGEIVDYSYNKFYNLYLTFV